MGKVLIEFEKNDNTTEVDTAYFEAIFSQCKCIDFKIKRVKEISSHDLNWCDVYIAIRPLSIYSLETARKVKEAGAFYIAFFDDDLLNTDVNPAWKWKVKYAKACLECADIVIGANPVLVEEYAQFTKTKRYAILNSAVTEEDILPVEPAEDKVKIVYAAGRDHVHFFYKYIKPIINSFLQENHERVTINFVGVEPELTEIEHKECFHFVPLMPYEKYNQFMRENRFDIGLAPLTDMPFENRKYFNKFIEYSKIGTLGLYSNCLPYTLVVRDKENGLLVNNDTGNWLKALEECVNDIELVKRCAKNAQKLLRDKFTIEAAVGACQTLIPELETYRRLSGSAIQLKNLYVKHAIFDARDVYSKLIYHLHNDGLKKTLILIKIKIRSILR